MSKEIVQSLLCNNYPKYDPLLNSSSPGTESQLIYPMKPHTFNTCSLLSNAMAIHSGLLLGHCNALTSDSAAYARTGSSMVLETESPRSQISACESSPAVQI